MIRQSVLLPCNPRAAFDLWVDEISTWWPADRRHTKDPDSRIFLLESGRFYEQASDGLEVELGRVRDWRRPERIELDFYPGTDPEHPTRVLITFAAEGAGTRVTVEHEPTESSRDLWGDRAARYVASWERVLPAFADAVRR